jgi:hypothetical protein
MLDTCLVQLQLQSRHDCSPARRRSRDLSR